MVPLPQTSGRWGGGGISTTANRRRHGPSTVPPQLADPAILKGSAAAVCRTVATGTKMTVLEVTTAATAMRVGGGALFGIGVEGRARGGRWLGGEGGGEREQGFITSCPPPPHGNWHCWWRWSSLVAFPVFHSGLCILVGGRWRWQGRAEVVVAAVARQVLV
jgi:hypothetical protein